MKSQTSVVHREAEAAQRLRRDEEVLDAPEELRQPVVGVGGAQEEQGQERLARFVHVMDLTCHGLRVVEPCIIRLKSAAHGRAGGAAQEKQGWERRFIDWNEEEQSGLLAEAKRLLVTGELFPQGTVEEPHAPDAEAEATDSEPEAARYGATGSTSGCRCSMESSHESA